MMMAWSQAGRHPFKLEARYPSFFASRVQGGLKGCQSLIGRYAVSAETSLSPVSSGVSSSGADNQCISTLKKKNRRHIMETT